MLLNDPELIPDPAAQPAALQKEVFGSQYFSRETLRLMNMLLARSKEFRKVNRIFGEGVNPLMRKIREALSIRAAHEMALRATAHSADMLDRLYCHEISVSVGD